MSTIFISHSSRDNDIAKELERRLAQQHHHSVFLDLDPEKGIVAGQSWERTLYRKLRACRAVIALCTDHYFSSHWCFAEIALARMEGKHIIALQVDPLSPDTPMPSILTEKQFIDIRANGEEGYQHLWRGLKEMDLLGMAGEWDPTRPPYLGLNAYQEADAPVFFGREDETRAGLELLDRGAPGLIMVLGASGSGKSSLVRAGMLPRLRREPERWLVVEPFRPGQDPFIELAKSLAQAYQRYAPDYAAQAGSMETLCDQLKAGAAELLRHEMRGEPSSGDGEHEPLPASDERLRRLMEQLEELCQQPPVHTGHPLVNVLKWSLDDLRRACDEPVWTRGSLETAPPGSTPLVALADHLRRVSERRDARVLLVIDQFEEMLGHDERDRLALRERDDTAHRFLTLLRASLDVEHSPLMALGTIRSDFLGIFQRHSALRSIDFESLSLGPMRIDGMRRVIEAPAQLGAIELEPGLADRLLEDTETSDALPLLSFTLWVLWRNYRVDGKLAVHRYEELGGLHGAVAAEANRLLDLAERQGKLDDLQRAFVQMARLTEAGGYARQPVQWDTPELSPVHPILEHFVNQRLLVSRDKDGTRMVEVAHEALFRSWQPLKTWLDNHRAELLLRQQLQRDAETWKEHQQTADNLWRGGRLQQAQELMRAGELRDSATDESLETAFVRAGIRRRNRQRWTLSGITLCVFAVLAGFLIYALDQAEEALNAQKKAESKTEEAQKEKVRADKEKFRALELARASTAQSLLGREPTKAALVLLEMDKPEGTGFTLTSQALGHEVVFSFIELRGHGGRVYSAVFSADGQRVVTASRDQTARLWDAASGKLLHILQGHDGEVLSAAFSTDGTRVVTASNDKTARLWDAASGKLLHILQGHDGEVLSAVFSTDGTRVVTASNDRTARLWDAASGKLLHVLQGHDGEVVSAVFSTDGTRVVTASWDQTARLWDAASGKLLHILQGHDRKVLSAVFSTDGTRVVTASWDQTARLWDAASGKLLHVLHGHDGWVDSAVFSVDGQRVVTASWDQTARLWDAASGKLLHVLQGHLDSVLSAAFSTDGTRVVTASNDGTARLWDAASGKLLHVLHGHLGWVVNAGFSVDGTRVATASRDGTVRLWAVETHQPLHVLQGHDDVVSAVFSADGQRVVTASQDQTARLWGVERGELLHVLRGHSDRLYSAVFSADGQRVVTASQDQTARLWGVERGELLHVLRGHSDRLYSAVFSADGQRVATASRDGTARLWGVERGELLHVLRGHGGRVYSAVFSADGQRVVTASQDQTARLWDAKSGRTLHVLQGHDGEVLSAVFSTDGTRVVTASWDQTARLWDAASGKLLHVLHGHDGWVDSAVFSVDGQRVVTASWDWTARLWDAASGKLLHVLSGHQGRTYHAEFSVDGQRVVTASWDQTARLWSVASGATLHVFRGHTEMVRSAAFSADGRRVVTASKDKTVRLWPLTQNLLRQMIRNKTKMCLNLSFRLSQLGESEDEARTRYEACEREQGRGLAGIRHSANNQPPRHDGEDMGPEDP